MKFLMTIYLVLMTVVFSHAQTETLPIKWSFRAEPEKEAGVYTIYATAMIEAGWHVFAPIPGGDGLLIPTQITLDQPELYRDLGNLQAEGKEIHQEMDGVGLVHFFEKQVTLKMTVHTDKTKVVKGFVTFQLCNEKMCLPPSDQSFEIKL
jgi:DsbC/DsbD-like thiol-disulfide interchange protein